MIKPGLKFKNMKFKNERELGFIYSVKIVRKQVKEKVNSKDYTQNNLCREAIFGNEIS